MRYSKVITCIPQQIKLLTWPCLILAEACCKISWGGRYHPEPGNLSSVGSLVSTAQVLQAWGSFSWNGLRDGEDGHEGQTSEKPGSSSCPILRIIHLSTVPSSPRHSTSSPISAISFFRFLPSVGLEFFQIDQHLNFYSPFTPILTSRLPS